MKSKIPSVTYCTRMRAFYVEETHHHLRTLLSCVHSTSKKHITIWEPFWVARIKCQQKMGVGAGMWWVQGCGNYGRSKQGIAEVGINLSTLSRTIEKKGLDGGIGNRANDPKTIGKILGFEERGVATCAQQQKTSNTRKRNTSWVMYADKNLQDCGDPPPPDGYLSSMNPPVLSTDKKVTGATTNVLRR